MKYLQYAKDNFLQLAMLLLIGVLFLQRGCSGGATEAKPTVTITRDSVWIFHDSTVHTAPRLVSTVPVPVEKWDTAYLPDTSYPALLRQYNTLAALYLASRHYEDSLRIDSLGYVYVNDSVTHNLIAGRSYKYSLKYPHVTERITIQEPYKPTRQLYIGGGIEGDKYSLVQKLKAGFLYKDRKDRIYIIEAGSDRNLNLSAELKSYWKLKF